MNWGESMSQVEEVLQHVSKLTKSDQLRVFHDLRHRLQDDVDQLGYLKDEFCWFSGNGLT